MNDLMTKSFLSYVDLKKQAMKDIEAERDIEMGQLDPNDETILSKFFEEVSAIKENMQEITNLLVDLQDLNEETKSKQQSGSKLLQGVRDRINSDVASVLRKARIIKTRLELLDKSNLENRNVYKEGSPIDRTRTSVTNGLRVKLRDLMNDFQCLREKILLDHKEDLKRRYYTATGEEPSEEMIENMISDRGEVAKTAAVGAGMVAEDHSRYEALKEIQRSLMELHQVFLDMAVMVETQGENVDNIEQNVVSAGAYVKDGTQELDLAKKMKKKKKKKKKKRSCACWIGVVVLVIILICLFLILV